MFTAAEVAPFVVTADALTWDGLESHVTASLLGTDLVVSAAIIAANWRLWAYDTGTTTYIVDTPSFVSSSLTATGVELDLKLGPHFDPLQPWCLIIPTGSAGAANRFGARPSASAGQFVSGSYVLAGDFGF